MAGLKNTIKGKILIYVSLIVIISLTIFGGVSIWLNLSSTDKVLEQSMNEMAEIAAERISMELKAYENLVIDAGCVARLADANLTTEAKKEIIDQRAEMHGFVRGNLLLENGDSLFDGNNYADRDYFKKAMSGLPYTSEPLVSKVTGKISFIIAAPLWENGVPNTRVVGVVYFVPLETFLNDIVSTINISKGGGAYMINAQGVTIADNTMDSIMTQNIEEEAKTDSSLKELAAIHAKMRQGISGFGLYQINGIKKFSAYTPVIGTDGWSIGITAPKSDFMEDTYTSILIMIVFLILAVLISSLFAFKMAGAIGDPIRLCAQRLDKLAQGDLKTAVPEIHKKDETGILADSTARLVEHIGDIITDLTRGLSEMGNGNFDIDSNVTDLYVKDFEPLKDGMYRVIQKLTSVLAQISQSADQVASGSDQVSSAAQALSQGATQQASSVQELAATINEIAEKVKQNADNAIQASQQTGQVGKEAEVSNQRMHEMLAAITEIREGSSQIEKIIKTIEDIAFQTNILALNAAVEAARAGSAGKGFAVVADEVRSLAEKSADASKNTSELIQNSLKSVENGTRIANETAESLEVVMKGILEVTESISDISEASGHQAGAVEQVRTGIDQISGVVQNNSATAEESAAASEELSSQAQMLKEMMATFKIKKL